MVQMVQSIYKVFNNKHKKMSKLITNKILHNTVKDFNIKDNIFNSNKYRKSLSLINKIL